MYREIFYGIVLTCIKHSDDYFPPMICLGKTCRKLNGLDDRTFQSSHRRYTLRQVSEVEVRCGSDNVRYFVKRCVYYIEEIRQICHLDSD